MRHLPWRRSLWRDARCRSAVIAHIELNRTHLTNEEERNGPPQSAPESHLFRTGPAAPRPQHRHRVDLRSRPPPTYVKAAGFTGRVDHWQEFEFVAPSSVLQWTGAADAGTGAHEGKRDGGFQFRLFHGLSPETETSCFYFWSVANGYRQNEPEATEQLFREIAPTFVEDRVMVEAQQARLTELGEAGLVDIASDATRMQMRRLVDRLMAAEQPGIAAE